MSFRAFHLPVETPSTLLELKAGDLTCVYPDPGGDWVDECARRLTAAGARLADRPLGGIVQAIDSVARRFLDPKDPLRVEAETLLPSATGYAPEMVRLVLDRMARDWTTPALEGLIVSEFGGHGPLEEFAERLGAARARAFGPRLGFHVFAGNVPGVAVTSLVRSLLVKAPAFGKTASGEPVLSVLFARALAEADSGLGDALAVTYWPGGGDEGAAERRILGYSDLAAVYGGEEVVAAIRRMAGPDTRIVVHGPRFSIGLIGRERAELTGGSAPAALVRDVAHAVATFDQQGCVSPHAIWIEDPERRTALTFARELGTELEHIEKQLPRGRLTPAEASAIQQARGTAELRGHAGHPVRTFAPEDTRWTVVYDPAEQFQPSCLNRFITLCPVDDLDLALERLRPIGHLLQSVALEVSSDRRDDLALRLARTGATRVTTFHRLPFPPPTWHHDGAGPLRELVRWVDLEE